MLNFETAGSKLLQIPGPNHRWTSEDVVINEDWQIVVKITAYNDSTGAIEGEKVWDEAGTPSTFYGKAVYNGMAGTPTSDEVEVDAYTVFYRVGEFNSGGTTDFELRTESAYNFSWVCFI